MKKQFEEDEELEQLLDEAFIREMQKQEQALFEQETAEPDEMTEQEIKEGYQDLVARLEKENKNGEEKKEIRLSKWKRSGGRKTLRRYHVAKAAGFVLVATLCVFGATMTSEATRSYFVDNIRYLAGDDTRIIVSNDENNEKSNGDEYEARAEIEETLGVEVPEFLYRPKQFEFFRYKINEVSGISRMEYSYRDQILMLYLDKGDETNVSITDSMHGEDVDVLNIEKENISIQIKKINDQADDVSSYSAQWEKEGTVYALSGKIELEEMKKILENMRY